MATKNIFEQKVNTSKLRKCQEEAYEEIKRHYWQEKPERSILVQLPTGTGKTGLIATMPFNLTVGKVLILTPNLKLAKDMETSLDIINNPEGNIYKKFGILDDKTLKDIELYTLRLEGTVNKTDIDDHQILIANYHQLQDIEKWFKGKEDSVDLIIIDEAHHQEADTYKEIVNFFGNAKVVGLTATPFRSDGKKVEGIVVYKYSFHRAIKDGIIRNIKISNVSPQGIKLSFTDSDQTTYTLEDILRMKEDSWFNKGIALSQDCCDSIASLAKEKLLSLNAEFPGASHQIIASAISKRHAREQVKPAFEKLGLNVGLVSSDPQEKKHNDKVFRDLAQGKIQVIIHIGMIGEGFDHPPLGVAAIFRPYKTLNPYIQFLGRVIRANEGTKHCYVVSHIGLNQIKRFEEFQLFDYEDKSFLEKLLSDTSGDISFVELGEAGERAESVSPTITEMGGSIITFEGQFVKEEQKVDVLYDQISQLTPEAQKKLLEKLGIETSGTKVSMEKKDTRLKPVDKRKASKNLLNEKEKSIVTDVMKGLGVTYMGRNFNPRFTNFVWIKRKVSKLVNDKLGIEQDARKTITNEMFEKMEKEGTLDSVYTEAFNYFKKKS